MTPTKTLDDLYDLALRVLIALSICVVLGLGAWANHHQRRAERDQRTSTMCVSFMGAPVWENPCR